MASAAVLPAPMPPTVVGPATKRATRPTNKLPDFLINGVHKLEKVPFDASRYVNFHPPGKIYSMQEIGLEGHGISPTAVTEPFPLFSLEAIQQMRSEIFSPEVLEHCQYTSTFCRNMVRGMGRTRAPFTYDAWYSPEIITRVSEVAGIGLVPSMDFEVANINISVPGTRQDGAKKRDGNDDDDNDDLPAFAWHFDSFPFVCVTMLSDCTGMMGGETALKTATGAIMKVRGPSMGTAVVMQGRYIEHQALKALGGSERTSMVTCFRPKSPFIKDETILTGVRGISNLSELYTQYTIYRLEILRERLRARVDMERRRDSEKRTFEIADVRKFVEEQKEFLDAMLVEVIDV